MNLTEDLLPRLYRSGLKITRGRGEFPLGRLNHRLFPNGQHFRMDSGNRFFIPGDPHFFGYMTGHEPYIARLIDQLLRAGDSCFDIGANIGYFTSQMAAKCGPGGFVAAYEPEDENYGWLLKNAALAADSGCKIETTKAAVSDIPGKRRMVHGAASTLHKTIGAAKDADGADVITSVSLDDEVHRLDVSGPIRLIKIDVEGHEPAVLRGMDRLVREARVEHAIIEISPGEHAKNIQFILDDWGDHVRSLCCWVDQKWQNYLPTDLKQRSDALVTFGQVNVKS